MMENDERRKKNWSKTRMENCESEKISLKHSNLMRSQLSIPPTIPFL
jgi:hypothetical protein